MIKTEVGVSNQIDDALECYGFKHWIRYDPAQAMAQAKIRFAELKANYKSGGQPKDVQYSM